MANTIPAQILAAIKARKFTSVSKLYAPGVDFQAWTPAGHWVASDGPTVARILEVWFTPGAPPVTIIDSIETAGARGAATLEYQVEWKLPPEDQTRVLRQVHLMTIKNDKIVAERVYCAGLHMEFPDVDIEKQRRTKGLAAPIAKSANNATPPAKVAAKAS